jgi:hypothetical protein
LEPVEEFPFVRFQKPQSFNEVRVAILTVFHGLNIEGGSPGET